MGDLINVPVLSLMAPQPMIVSEIGFARFFKNEATSTKLENQIVNAKFLLDFAFSIDLIPRLDELNLKLQGKQQNIDYGHIREFKNKIELFKSLLEKHDFPFF